MITMKAAEARSRSTQGPSISEADRAEAQRIISEAQKRVVPDPAKDLDGRSVAAIFGHLAADRVDADAAELETLKSDIFPVSGGSMLREAALRRTEATAMRESSNRSLEPPGPLLDVMGEMIPARLPGEERPADNGRAHLLNTLERPTTISANASQRRLALLSDACAVNLGVDAAHSWQAANSIEKMLCHQLAAAHYAAMRLFGFLGHSHGASDRQLPPVECARLGNTAARLLETFQSGCLTLQKLKTGGAQRVIVQRQQIVQTKDGQTLVIGEVAPRRSKRRRRARRRRGTGPQSAR